MESNKRRKPASWLPASGHHESVDSLTYKTADKTM